MLEQFGTITIPTISTEELLAKRNKREQFEFWNVLTDEYFSNENIPGSRHVPLSHIGREIVRLGLSKDAEIIVYCSGPECIQSAFAFEKLHTLGFTNVRVYAGGLDEWEAAGMPLTKFQTITVPELRFVAAAAAFS